MHYIAANNFAGLYHKALDLVYATPDYETAPRGMKIRECMNVVMELVNPTLNLFKCEDKSLTMPTGYTKKEIALYLAAYKNVDLFGAAAPFWKTIANADGTVNSAYGDLIFGKQDSGSQMTQYSWAVRMLQTDKDTRQAYMLFNRPMHQFLGNKDVPCTLSEIFHIRNNKLNATVTMRSNDLVSGFVHDIPSFTLFQWLVYKVLKTNAYPDLELGTYTHIVYSLHLYEKDFDLTRRRLLAGILPNSFPLPENPGLIKSEDINKIIDAKFNGAEITGNWDYPENEPFYTWLLTAPKKQKLAPADISVEDFAKNLNFSDAESLKALPKQIYFDEYVLTPLKADKYSAQNFKGEQVEIEVECRKENSEVEKCSLILTSSTCNDIPYISAALYLADRAVSKQIM